MEPTSPGINGAGGLEAVQGFIQDYQLPVLQGAGVGRGGDQTCSSTIVLASSPCRPIPCMFTHSCFSKTELEMGLGIRL